MRKKENNPNRLGSKAYAGSTMMALSDGIGQAIMTSMFMMYLTDYAGIGKWGVVLGTALLLAARLFDAVNDPLEGYIMDRAPVGKHGKYRPFLLISTIAITLGLIGLFFLPSGFADNPVMICVWVIFFYLLYDIGASFYAPNLVYRTMTLDTNERSKLMIGPRIIAMVCSVVAAQIINIVNSVNSSINNMHTSFGITVTAVALAAGLIAVLGLALVKERHHVEREKEESFKITDIFGLIKRNYALRTNLLAGVFSGFVYTFIFTTANYYLKWAYCVDFSTGAVDSDALGGLVGIAGFFIMVSAVIGTFVAGPLMKKVGSAMKLHKLLIAFESVCCALMLILHVAGVLAMSPYVFLLILLLVGIAFGADFIPGETISIELMDYEIYKNGKDRSGLVNACGKFLNKAQSALAGSILGAILIMFGYNVDSETDMFLGELSAIPRMNTGFVVVMGLIGAVLGVIALVILRKYPITDEIRAEMRAALDQADHKAE